MNINETITIQQARYFMLKKHGLIGPFQFKGKEDILKFVNQVGCIQFDPIDVCGKNPELVLQSRIENFRKEMLSELLYEERQLVDYFDKNLSIFNLKDWPYFSYKRKRYSDKNRNKVKIKEACDAVLSYIHENTFACSKDINLKEKVNWDWNDTSLGRATLEALYFKGDLVIHHKKNTIKYYSLAKDFIDSHILQSTNPNKSLQEQIEWSILRRIGAVGLLWNKASDAWLGIDGLKSSHRVKAFENLKKLGKIIEITVENLDCPLYLLSEDRQLLESSIRERHAIDDSSEPQIDILPRVSFLAPLDNMLWDRKLIKAIFNFEYKWEIYTPLAERKFGYYVLPILYKDTFIGRIEMINQKKSHILEVKKIWLEKGFKPDRVFKKNLRASIKRFATFNTCTQIEYFQKI